MRVVTSGTVTADTDASARRSRAPTFNVRHGARRVRASCEPRVFERKGAGQPRATELPRAKVEP